MAMKQLHATDRDALIAEIGRLHDVSKISENENEKRVSLLIYTAYILR